MEYDLVIIGAGPGGYIPAIRAGQAGLRTALVEKSHLGGMCLNWGCVAARSMQENARFFDRVKKAYRYGIEGVEPDRVEFSWKNALERTRRIVLRLARGIAQLLEKNRVEVYRGLASIEGENLVVTDGGRRIMGRNIIIATGSRPESFPVNLPGDMVMEIDQLFRSETVPHSVAVAGDNPTAVEIAQLLSLTGRSVTLLLSGESFPAMGDPYVAGFIHRLVKESEISLMMKSPVEGAWDGGVVAGGKKILCGTLVNCRRRLPVLPQANLPIKTDDDGFIVTDEFCRTSIPNIYAVGDVNGRSTLALGASAQGITAVNHILGIKQAVDYSLVPFNLYTYPEVAWIGKTEPEIKKAGINYRVTEYSFASNAKAYMEDDTDGFIRILSDRSHGGILGVQIASIHATDLISEASVIMQMEGTIFDMSRILHAHPTISEVFTEAGAMAVDSYREG